MRIKIITSCTSLKTRQPPHQLTLADFQLGPAHVKLREQELADFMQAAEEIYIGQQHHRLMRGVRAARSRGVEVDVWILSAGMGWCMAIARSHPMKPPSMP